MLAGALALALTPSLVGAAPAAGAQAETRVVPASSAVTDGVATCC